MVVSTYRGKDYDFCAPVKAIDQTPSWSEDEDFPPLSPRGAIRSAKGELSELVTDAENWTLREIELRGDPTKDKWIYIVSFGGPGTPTGGGADGAEFRIMVLMDGKAVKPDVYPLAH